MLPTQRHHNDEMCLSGLRPFPFPNAASNECFAPVLISVASTCRESKFRLRFMRRSSTPTQLWSNRPCQCTFGIVMPPFPCLLETTDIFLQGFQCDIPCYIFPLYNSEKELLFIW